MSTKYFSLLTQAGTDKLKKAASSGMKLEITHMAVGDGNGNLPTPDANQSQLVNEQYRAEIDSLTIDPNNHNLIITEHFIPEGNGNWWVREIGLFDKEGTLIAIGNCGEIYKPESLEQMVRMTLAVDDHSQMEWIGLISGIATRQYVRNKIKDHADSRNHPDATLKEKGLVALSNDINSNNETHAATPKAVKTAYELADKAYKLAETVVSTDKYVPLTRKINGKELIHDVELAAADVNAYNKQETDGLIQPVKVQAEDAMKLAETAKKNAEIAVIQVEKKVPLTRKINGKELVNDIELTAADVHAYSKQETDDLLQPVRALSEDAMQLAVTANNNATTGIDNATKAINDVTTTIDEMKVALAGKVPLTRKINGKELVDDVELTATDVHAYSKQETDNLIQPVKVQAEDAIKLAETAKQSAENAVKLAEKKVPLTRKINGKELVDDVELTATDVHAYSKQETDSLIQPVKVQAEDAMKLAETAKQSAENAVKLAEKKVPLTRKINGKELIDDVELTATDVHAYNKQETDNLIQPVKVQAEDAMKLAETAKQSAEDAVKLAEKKVPLTRKINGKELVDDVELTATDVHAYNKQETDNLIQPVKVQAEDAMKLAEKKVPLTRKINGKELIDDVELTATDVHAYNKQETDNLIQPVKMQAEDAMKLAETAKQSAEDAVKLAEKKVPLTRKINGKELVNDVELTAADIHAYSKQETDNLIQPVKVQAEDAMKLAETANSNATTGIDTATKAINEMKAAIAGKVPLTRKINGKELTNDIELTASDLHVYTTEEVDGFIDDVRNLAHEANNNANGRVPMGRKVNGKALSSDIELAASDIGTYTKTEIDIKVDNVEAKAKEANNNANSRVPMERTVNGKALLSDIKLVASDVGAYTRTEVDTRINKVEVLASNANGNANGRLEKNQNGADIPDKQAFVRNIGLGDLVGLDITSSLIGVEHTIVRLGEIFMINGLIKDTKAIAKFNISEIGGVTYYTNFYQITLPMTLPNGIISCHASIVGDNFDNQKPGILADVKTQRNNANGMGLSKDTLTISVTTPHLDWIPYFYYQVVGY